MASLNKAQIIGRLGSDVEIRYTASGIVFANISVATSENIKIRTDSNKKQLLGILSLCLATLQK